MMLTRPRAPSPDSHLSVVGSPPWKPRRPPEWTGRAPGGDQDACARAGPRSGRRCLRRPAASSQTSSDCSSQPKVESALRRDRPQLDQTCVLLQRGKDCKTNSRLTKKKHSISFLNGNTTSAPLKALAGAACPVSTQERQNSMAFLSGKHSPGSQFFIHPARSMSSQNSSCSLQPFLCLITPQFCNVSPPPFNGAMALVCPAPSPPCSYSGNNSPLLYSNQTAPVGPVPSQPPSFPPSWSKDRQWPKQGQSESGRFSLELVKKFFSSGSFMDAEGW